MAKYEPIPLDRKVFLNIDEASLTRANALLMNGFINESGGHTRFPGLTDFILFPNQGPVYLYPKLFRGDMIAATGSGSVYKIGSDGSSINVTGIPIGGGRRVIFGSTEDGLIMAAGGQIVLLSGEKTEALSGDAPLATHAQYIDGYVVANEIGSGRWNYSEPGQPRVWPALNIYTAESRPDAVLAMIVTDFRELMVCGTESIEQFEPIPNADQPFFRRWATGEDIKAPYTLLDADNAIWLINQKNEFVRSSAQLSEPKSDDIQILLERVKDWTSAFAFEMIAMGQKFIVLTIPAADNLYGGLGVTLLFDYRRGYWYTLASWDSNEASPIVWPGYSFAAHWGHNFVGVDNGIAKLDPASHTNQGVMQPMRYRSAHIAEWGEARIDNLRMRVKRGVSGPNATEPTISVRFKKDNADYTRWVRRSLGRYGARPMEIQFGSFGNATTFQMEYEVTDDCEVEVVGVDALVERIGR